MITEPLLHYIREQLSMGVSKDAIVKALIAHGGWEHDDIDEAFSVIGSVPLRTTHVHRGTYHRDVRYVGFPARVIASCIDATIAAALTVAIVSLIGVQQLFTDNRTVIAVYAYTYFFVSLLYFSISTFIKGTTIGKKSIGAVVVSDTFEPLSLEKVIMRECVNRLLSFLTVCSAYAFVAFSEKKQGLHDTLAKSVVVYEYPSHAARKERRAYVVVATAFFVVVAAGAFTLLFTFFAARRYETYRQQQRAMLQRTALAITTYHTTQQSYGYAKNCISGMFLDPSIQPLILSLKGTPQCIAFGDTYAVSIPEYKKETSLCIDSDWDTKKQPQKGKALQYGSVEEGTPVIALCQ